MNCQRCDQPVMPGTERCRNHSWCYLCGGGLSDDPIHPACSVDGGPVEYACDPCFKALMERFRLPSPAPPSCDGCGAAFGAGCSCAKNARSIGRGEAAKCREEEPWRWRE
jgi:hypothetical protein